MKIRKYALASVLGALVLVFAIITILTNRLFESTTESTEASQYQLMRKIVEFNIQGAENRALARAEIVASMPSVQDLFAQKDRAGLMAELKQMYDIQRDKFGIDQGQFHLAPGTSFLRLHAPDKFGDDLSKSRPIVVAVNADNVARKGLSISRTGPGIFGVVPVLDRKSGKPIGTFEFGGDFGAVLDSVKSAYGLESAVFIDEERLRNSAPNLGGDIYTEKNRMGKFIKYKSTNWELIRNLVSDAELSSTAADQLNYTRTAQDTPFGVVIIPLRNPAGDVLGMVVAAKDFSPSRSSLGQSMIWLGMYSLFGLVILAGVVIVLIRGAIILPLNVLTDRLGKLAAGEQAEPLESIEGFYGEIAEAAEHYETLRAQSQAKLGKVQS